MAVELVGNRLPGRAVDKPVGSSLSMGLSMALRRFSINPQTHLSIAFLSYIFCLLYPASALKGGRYA